MREPKTGPDAPETAERPDADDVRDVNEGDELRAPEQADRADSRVDGTEEGDEAVPTEADAARSDGDNLPDAPTQPGPAVPKAAEEDKSDAPSDKEAKEMTFTAHLEELRVRLTRCLIGAFIGLLACYAFAEQLFAKLVEPLLNLLQPSGGTLIYTGLPEAFFTHLKVAAVAGLFVSSPYIFYQLWMFIAPGLYEGERKWIIPIAFVSAVFFASGALFGYYVVFPFGFQFFLGFASDFITPMPSVKEYFSFATSMLFAFGLIFELPLFIFFLARLGIVTHQSLRKFQKYAILCSFIIAAILTPPDVVSQTLMAGPMVLLYEVGIWVAYWFGRKPKEAAADEAVPGDAAKG